MAAQNIAFSCYTEGNKTSANQTAGPSYVNIGERNRQMTCENEDSHVNGLESATDNHSYHSLQFGDVEGERNDHVYLSFRSHEPEKSRRSESRGSSRWKAAALRQRKIMIVVVLVCILVSSIAMTLAVVIDKRDTGNECSFAEPSGPILEGKATTSMATENVSSKTTMQTVSFGNFTTQPYTEELSTISSFSLLETTSERLSISERCQSYEGLIPHPDECQAYYNCSNHLPYFKECIYPDLFNAETLSCEYFENVRCNGRKEAKDGCDYSYIQCSRGHCIPCSIRYPRCSGKKTGSSMHDEKPWTPFYLICYKERFITENQCPSGYLSSPDFMECVTLDWIPKEHGGFMPNCTGRVDGLYPDVIGRCRRFHICEGEQYIGYGDCDDLPVFDEVLKTCRSPDVAFFCTCQNNC